MHVSAATVRGTALLFAAIGFWEAPVQAELPVPHQQESPISVNLTANAGFDDAVFIEETDTGTSGGDAFLETEIGIDWRIVGKSGGPNLEISYGYARTDYEDFSEFDIQSHQLSGTGHTKIGKADLSIAYNYRHIQLAGTPLLDLHIMTPTASLPMTRQLIGVLTYSRSRKVFATLPERDAVGHQISATLIKLLDLKGSYIFAGGGVGRERARTAEFHNNSIRVDGSVSKKAPFGFRDFEISASAAFERRNYTGFNMLVQGLRRDRDYDISAKAKYSLSDRLSAQLSWERSISKSNVEFARYSGNKVELSLIWEI